MRIAAASGSAKRSSSRATVDLPQPLGPVSATISPGSTRSEKSVERRRVRARVGEADVLELDAPRADTARAPVARAHVRPPVEQLEHALAARRGGQQRGRELA